MNRKHSFNIDNEPNWTNPIHIGSSLDSYGDSSDLFYSSGISYENNSSKRKSVFADPESKVSKSKHETFTNIIDNDENGLLNDEEIQALSDSFSDSFDDESLSGDDSVYGNDDEVESLTDKKSRGNYACSKCGLPKRGHICPFQTKNRRRGGLVNADFADNQRRIVAAKFKPSGPVIKCDAQVGSDGNTGAISWKPAEEKEMVSTGSQCELTGKEGTVRELYLDAQGFPESYANGILADPSFDVRTARTITVSRPAPKSYKPKVTTSSCGAGPDLVVPPTAPLMIPPFVVPSQNQRVLPSNNRALDMSMNFLQSNNGLPLPHMGNLGNLPALAVNSPSANPLLNLNNLALLMNTYQLQSQNSVDDQQPIDPALASLFFPFNLN
jgi:hypothetical protein